jgi:hypothetical protein
MRRSSALQPVAPSPTSPPPAQRRRRRSSLWRQLARHTTLLEIGSRLGLTSTVGLVASLSLAQLVPHLQAQVQALESVRQELAQAETIHYRLRSDFNRYFDPAQASRVMQEQTGYRAQSERQVVWTD